MCFILSPRDALGAHSGGQGRGSRILDLELQLLEEDGKKHQGSSSLSQSPCGREHQDRRALRRDEMWLCDFTCADPGSSAELRTFL